MPRNSEYFRPQSCNEDLTTMPEKCVIGVADHFIAHLLERFALKYRWVMEFYLSYAIPSDILLTLDSGHFHPTETIIDKISALLLYLDQLLLHVSRGVRWDSAHVVTFNDELQAITQEIVRNDALSRVHIGLDYFDASINRTAAWTTGARNTLRALLNALLEPLDMLNKIELSGDYSHRLALLEELKALPAGAVWDYCCLQQGVPVGVSFMNVIKDYEKKELVNR